MLSIDWLTELRDIPPLVVRQLKARQLEANNGTFGLYN